MVRMVGERKEEVKAAVLAIVVPPSPRASAWLESTALLGRTLTAAFYLREGRMICQL